MVSLDRQDLIIIMEAGYIYLGMGRFQEARDVFEGAAVLAPASEIPLVAIGTSYFAQQKFDPAIKAYQRALAAREESPFAHAYLGEALFFKGKKAESLRELERAAALDPSGTAGGFARSLIDMVKKGFEPPSKVKHN